MERSDVFTFGGVDRGLPFHLPHPDVAKGTRLAAAVLRYLGTIDTESASSS